MEVEVAEVNVDIKGEKQNEKKEEKKEEQKEEEKDKEKDDKQKHQEISLTVTVNKKGRSVNDADKVRSFLSCKIVLYLCRFGNYVTNNHKLYYS